ncbi:MAG TPA: radical SAM protein, partial [Ruminococcaceae bacterium]|nr:radical SAM protein [Oscillospiraceae bacterium]
MGADPVVARAALHFWEEPCISGKNGSGTVFFTGCPLRCAFCQNDEISRRRAVG